MVLKLSLAILLSLIPLQSFGQSIFDTFGGQSSSSSSADLVTERLDRISISRRIFIITNRNNSFGKGDFITLLVNSQPVARALVAKVTEQNLAGIKIVTIYSLSLWNELRAGQELQVLRGDDSTFRNQRQDQGSPEETALIQDEDDLFNDTTFLEDDLQFDENQNRALKNDHMLTVTFSSVEGLNNDFATTRYNQISAAYAYQIDDNIFLEASAGQNVINDFPSLGLDTRLINLVARVKYTFEGPFFTFFQPYVGYQMISASSDEAGIDDGIVSADDLAKELELVEGSNKNQFVFGVTAMRRLVPGWFLRVDLGTDVVAGGLSLEF